MLRPSHPFRSAEARERYLSHYDAQAAAWPVASQAQTVRTSAGETFVRMSGPADAPPLVLLPGVWASGLMWAPLIARLSESYRTYAVDNICDFGRSVSARPIRDAAGFTQWLDGLFDALGLRDGINLMGMSRGGWLAAEYTLHAPRRLAAAVWHSPAGVLLVDYLAGLKAMPKTFPVLLAPSVGNVRAMMLGVTPDLARTDPDAFQAFVEETALGLECFDTKVVGSALGPRRFSDDELRGIQARVLYIAGEHETMYSPLAAAARLHAIAPGVEIVIVAGAGHDLGVGVRREEFADQVLHFLRGRE